jgi:hypothetical protein|uniref:hypothetical protein n=1 Tax=Polynucleobacter sp. TaxID=2029855 RepID=UPI0040471F1E
MFGWFKKVPQSDISPELIQAQQLIKAIDRGGVPLNPIKVNNIARALGLDVATTAPVEHTIERIRKLVSNL